MRVANYVGKDLRILEAGGDGTLKTVRYYPSCGQARVQSELVEGAPIDGVPSGILRATVTGMPDQDSEVVLIVRQDVANVVLRTAESLVALLLVPYDPVLVPEELRFRPDLRVSECELIDGTLGSAQARELLAQNYVCYGYRRLVLMEHGEVDTLKLIFPSGALAQWPTQAERVAELKGAFAAQCARASSLGCSLTVSDAYAVLKLPGSVGISMNLRFDFNDDGLSSLMLRLDALRQKRSAR